MLSFPPAYQKVSHAKQSIARTLSSFFVSHFKKSFAVVVPDFSCALFRFGFHGVAVLVDKPFQILDVLLLDFVFVGQRVALQIVELSNCLAILKSALA